MKKLLPVLSALWLCAAAHADSAYTAYPLREIEKPAQTAPVSTAAPLESPAQKRFEELSSETTGVTAKNEFNDARMWADRFREFTLGALETGVAIGDFDRDGHPDIFVVSKNGPCALYRQVAPFKFVNIAAQAGVECKGDDAPKTGATIVDINQDGWPDIYVCRFDAPNLLFINNHDGTFTERAHEYGLDIRDSSVHAVFADYDRDGYLDCFIVTNILDFEKSPQGRRDYLMHNNRNGTFTDVSKQAGISGIAQGHTAIWFDANQDGWPDLYIANDFETPDRFYLNNGDGTFTDVVDDRLPHVTYFSMGADSGDINNDGLIDFMVADMRDRTRAKYITGMEEVGRGLWDMDRITENVPQYMWNAVYLGTGTDHFQEVAHLTGMEATGWTWSARFADLDNDGKLDAFFTTGMVRNFVDADLVEKQNSAPSLAARAVIWKNTPLRHERTVAYRNLGDLQFRDVSKEWGLDHEGISFGCAIADLDGDGVLDLVYANYDAPPTIIRNHSAQGHRVVIELAGRAPNLNGIGAEVHLTSASGSQMRQLYTERGIVASEPPLLYFGLGADTVIQTLTVHWPRGQVQTLTNLPVDRRLVIVEPPAPATAPAPAVRKTRPAADALFVDDGIARGIDVIDRKKIYDEFVRQRLLPRRLDLDASAIAIADVNHDGRPDVFISGVSDSPGKLFLGQADGHFIGSANEPWAGPTNSIAQLPDNTAALFFDVNGDGALDLIVAGGGDEHPRGSPLLGARVYLNRGDGSFAPAPNGFLPENHESCAALAAANVDGTALLFVGGRVVPAHWPDAPRSFLFRNDGGVLQDVTDQLAPGLREIGMVTAATFQDIDGDGRPDLVLTLEFGPVVLFHNTGHGFENRTQAAGLAVRIGWWSALAIADVNGDGRLDLIVGNVGLNTKYRASPESPTYVYVGDFDGRGHQNIIEAETEDGKIYPIRGRSRLAAAFPWLTKKFPTYAAYSHAALNEIFAPEILAKARRFQANELASGIYLQKADGSFEFHALPRAAQVSPINGIAAADFDGDGLLDLYCVGNNFGPEPSTGRFDGGLTLLLKGDGQGNFMPVPFTKSGLIVPGDTRNVGIITHASAVAESATSADKPSGNKSRTIPEVDAVIVTQSNGPVHLFSRK